jgi:hypothetical protein
MVWIGSLASARPGGGHFARVAQLPQRRSPRASLDMGFLHTALLGSYLAPPRWTPGWCFGEVANGFSYGLLYLYQTYLLGTIANFAILELFTTRQSLALCSETDSQFSKVGRLHLVSTVVQAGREMLPLRDLLSRIRFTNIALHVRVRTCWTNNVESQPEQPCLCSRCHFDWLMLGSCQVCHFLCHNEGGNFVVDIANRKGVNGMFPCISCDCQPSPNLELVRRPSYSVSTSVADKE